MSDNVSAVISATDTNGNAKSTVIPNINPDVGGATLRDFAQSLIGLTNDTYVGTNRVDKTDLANAADPPVKTTPTLSLSRSSMSLAQFKTENNNIELEVTYDGDAPALLPSKKFTDYPFIRAFTPNLSNDKIYWYIAGAAGQKDSFQPCSFELISPETDNYKEARVTFSITD